MLFRAVFLRFGTARIRNGRIQASKGVSGRMGAPAPRARDRLLAGGDPSSEALNLSSLCERKVECRERFGGMLRHTTGM